ncbi:MAG TPA: elongation factor P [Patescibacteria group bacterium]|nr:elongation factor P [Patescibacteria group bacterium]
MINVTDLRAGTTFKFEGAPFVVLKYEHVKMGRGSATIRVKIKNLETGTVLEHSFINSAKVEPISTLRKKLQYLYGDGTNYTFMDPISFDQVDLSRSVIADAINYIKEGESVNILFWDEKPLWVELPPKMEFKIKDTPPGIKGNSASNMYKDAVLENGISVRVPLFINIGDKIRVDTRSGEYVERVK